MLFMKIVVQCHRPRALNPAVNRTASLSFMRATACRECATGRGGAGFATFAGPNRGRERPAVRSRPTPSGSEISRFEPEPIPRHQLAAKNGLPSDAGAFSLIV